MNTAALPHPNGRCLTGLACETCARDQGLVLQRVTEQTIAIARAAANSDWARVRGLARDLCDLGWSAALADVGATAGALVLNLMDDREDPRRREQSLAAVFAEVHRATSRC